MHDKGKIVLIPFPFTDLSSQKVRPALIIGKKQNKSEDIVVSFISSSLSKRPYKTDILVRRNDKLFNETGLRGSSTIRIDKIATLDKRLVLGEIGELPKFYEQKVSNALKYLFGL